MKIRKNLEAVFLAASVLALTASYATAKVPALRAAPATAGAVAGEVKMQTVVVKAKRLTAAEKAALV